MQIINVVGMADVGPAKLDTSVAFSVNNSTAELCGGMLGNYLLRSLDMSGGGARKCLEAEHARR